MQIIPAQILSLGMPALSYYQGSPTTKGSGIFADMLKPDYPAVPASTDQSDPSSSVQAVLQPAPGRVAASATQLSEPDVPRSQADGPLRNVKMTQEDYSDLKDKLEAAGVPKDQVEELGRKIQSPEGLTWGQFMVSLHQIALDSVMKPVNLTDDDKAAVSSLLTKLGFEPKRASQLTDALANGKPGQVLNAITARLKNLDPDQPLTLSKDEVGALGKALNLSGKAQQQLLAQFQGQDSLDLTADGARQLFASIKGETAGLLAQAQVTMKSLADQVEPVMFKAQGRMNLSQEAMNAKAQATQATAPQAFRNPQETAGKDASQNASQNQNSNQNQNANQNFKDEAGNPGWGRGQSGSDSPGFQKDARQNGQGLSDHGAVHDSKSSADQTWGDFLGKIRVDGQTQTTPDALLTAGQSIAVPVTAQAQTLAKGTDPTAAKTQSSQFLEQVESGILKNMGQGVKQLSLELTPETLGKLNVVLTVKGKDVQAVIKAETPEAEKVLSDNLQQLKQTLENQGLTVSKLEVRTGLPQDSNLGQQWAGTDKHNLSQERREALERMRTTSLLSGGDGAGLAHQMQSSGAEVKNSQGGLDIIA